MKPTAKSSTAEAFPTESNVPDDRQPMHSFDMDALDEVDDKANREFYNGSVTDRYRLKSELVSRCMEEIGMGRYQWELFVVTGFGWITDNLYVRKIACSNRH